MYLILCWTHALKNAHFSSPIPPYVNFELLFILISVCHYYRNVRLLSEPVRLFSELVRYKFKSQFKIIITLVEQRKCFPSLLFLEIVIIFKF